jgi:formylglycine-generating enzyme required for sulfatase activity
MQPLLLLPLVTLEQYQRFKPGHANSLGGSVTSVSALEADGYVDWLNAESNDVKYRLMTSEEFDTYQIMSPILEWASTTCGKSRVARGGSFGYDDHYARVAGRFRNHPDNRYISLGFRVVVCI